MPTPTARSRPRVEPFEDRTAPAVLTVNTTADGVLDDPVLTYREALTLVNAGAADGLGRPLTAGEAAQVTGTFGSADRIRFESTPGVPLAGTIAVMGDLPVVSKAVAVEGPGAKVLTISGSDQVRVLDVAAAVLVTVDRLTLANGSIGETVADGQVVRNAGTLVVTECVVGPSIGAAVRNLTGGSLTMDRCAVLDAGRGIHNLGTVTLTNCTVAGHADRGIFQPTTLAGASIELRNCTITSNAAQVIAGGPGGGGIEVTGKATPVRMFNTLVAGNQRTSFNPETETVTILPGDARGPIDPASAFNLIGADIGVTGIAHGANGNQVGTLLAPIDPRLGPQADNGGPTSTYALLAGSPARDAGDPAFALPVATDQRGLARVANGRLDIGAFEAQGDDTQAEPTPPDPGPASPPPPPPSDRATVRLFAVGAGYGGGPRVRVFNADGSQRFDFFAFDENLRTGVNVATADVDGDGVEDIVVGVGKDGGPRVRVFSGVDLTLIDDFFAYDETLRVGVEVAAGDIDGDGKAEVFTVPRDRAGPHVRGWRIVAGSHQPLGGGLGNFFAFDENLHERISLACTDLDGDGKAELIVASCPTGPDGTRVVPTFRVFAADGRLVSEVTLADAFLRSPEIGALPFQDGAAGSVVAVRAPYVTTQANDFAAVLNVVGDPQGPGFLPFLGAALYGLDVEGTEYRDGLGFVVGGATDFGARKPVRQPDGTYRLVADHPTASTVRVFARPGGDPLLEFDAFEPEFHGGIELG